MNKDEKYQLCLNEIKFIRKMRDDITDRIDKLELSKKTHRDIDTDNKLKRLDKEWLLCLGRGKILWENIIKEDPESKIWNLLLDEVKELAKMLNVDDDEWKKE